MKVFVCAAVAALLLSSSAVATVVEFPTCPLPASADQALCTHGRNPNEIVKGPDDALWFTLSSNEIGRMTPSGALTLFPLSSSQAEPQGMAVGSDGALWFAEPFGDRIGRITTAGAVTEYPLPANSYPHNVTRGADGAIWFTESKSNKIGRITTSGTLSEFPLPTPPAPAWKHRPWQIATGPDGNLYFTEQQARRIDRITPSGVSTQYPLPSAGGSPNELTAGPDGAIWFSDWSGDVIGHMTTTGLVTSFPLPPESRPSAIGRGPDGTIWFGKNGLGDGYLGHITATGLVTLEPLLSGAVNGITTGPDDLIWYTDTARSRVGYITGSRHSDSSDVPIPDAGTGDALPPASPPGTIVSPAPVTVSVQSVDLSGAGLEVSLVGKSAADLSLLAAVSPTTSSSNGATIAKKKSALLTLGKTKASLVRGDHLRVKLSLTKQGRSFLSRGKSLTVQLGVWVKGKIDRRTTFTQRSFKLKPKFRTK